MAPTFTSTSGTLVRPSSADEAVLANNQNANKPFALQNTPTRASAPTKQQQQQQHQTNGNVTPSHRAPVPRDDSDTFPAQNPTSTQRQPSAGTPRAPVPAPAAMLNGHHTPSRSSGSAGRHGRQPADAPLFHQPGGRASEEIARPHGHFQRDVAEYQGEDSEDEGQERGRAGWR